MRRIFIYVLYSMNEMLVFFQRTCPAVLYDSMATSFNTDASHLSIFSSMYFYSYGVLQPFTGLVADVVEPAFLNGASTFVSSIGAVLCGLAGNFTVGCIGRLLVGLGCAPIFPPVVRFVANWFALRWFPVLTGVLTALGSVGAILGQEPTAHLAEAIGWRWCFHIVGIIGVVFGIVIILFTRGHPSGYGYEAVNKNAGERMMNGPISVKDRASYLWANFKLVIASGHFWLCAAWSFVVCGPFNSVVGFWGGPFLRDVYGYNTVNIGKVLMGMSIGATLGCLVMPTASSLLKTRKWVIFVATIIAAGAQVALFIWMEQLTMWPLILVLAAFAFCTNPLAHVLYAMVREYFPSAVAATAVGCMNAFAFIGAAVDQVVTGAIQNTFPKPDIGAYSKEAYKWGLLMFTIGNMGLGLIFIGIAKDTDFNKVIEKGAVQADENEVEDIEEVLDERSRKGGLHKASSSGAEQDEAILQDLL
jgi:sugar phosphate permease